RHDLSLRDSGALPLRAGDQVRVESEVEPAGYLYVFWIDSDGHADPVYPWQSGTWGTRPGQEQSCGRLSLPEKVNQAWPIGPGSAGMETLVLLVRDTPLPTTDEELKKRLEDLPVARSVQDQRAAVWFENG